MKKKMNIIGYFTTPIKVIEGDLSCMQDISSYALDVKDLLNCYKWIGDEKGIATKGFGKLINRLI